MQNTLVTIFLITFPFVLLIYITIISNVLIKASGDDPHFENSFLIESKEDESLLVVVNLYSLNDEQFGEL